MEKRNIELAVVTGIKFLAAAGVAYVAYLGFGPLFHQDSWPPKNEREAEELIARYKQKLRMGDSPLSPRTPEDTARYLGRIIDHEVKKGELTSGRDYITQAINQKMDNQVESLTTWPESNGLIAKMRNAVKKHDDLIRVGGHYKRRPGEATGKEAKDKFDRELQTLAAQFCETPFDLSVCPELAEEIGKTYKAKLEAAKQDPRLKNVVDELERNCLPRQD